LRSYRYSRALDTWRLVRGIFSPARQDPYIGTWPAMIGARDTLFRWSDIAHDRGMYRHGFEGYTPYVSSQPIRMEHLPEAYARDAFTHLMDARLDRIAEITALLERHDVPSGPGGEPWEAIGRWVVRHVESVPPPAGTSDSRAKHARPIWRSITLDLALLLGEQAIARRGQSSASWRFHADTPYANAADYGRGLWLLLEPLPPRPTTAAPARVLIEDLLDGIVSIALHGTPAAVDPEDSAAAAARRLFESIVEGAESSATREG